MEYLEGSSESELDEYLGLGVLRSIHVGHLSN